MPYSKDQIEQLLANDQRVKVAGIFDIWYYTYICVYICVCIYIFRWSFLNKLDFSGVDVDGILRGKILTKSKFLSTLDDGFGGWNLNILLLSIFFNLIWDSIILFYIGFCSVIFGWDMHDRAYSEELEISNSNNG